MIEDPRFNTNERRIQPENRRILNQAISEWFGRHEIEEALETCDRLGITAGPITTMKDIDEDRHYNERGTIVEIKDPVTGTALKIPNVPFRMMGTPGRIRFPGLPHGSANTIVFRDLLGYTDDEIEKLREAKVV